MSIESIESIESNLSLETVMAAFKQFGSADLFKVIRTATTLAEKCVKSEAKPLKKEKGSTPKQLRKPAAWVKYVLEYAHLNGWEEFVCVNKKKNEEVEYPASIEVDGKHVFPDGKKLILTQAMSLSKKWWAPKEKTGSNEELYRTFEAEFAAQPEEAEAEEAEEAPAKPVMVRKTAAEKAKELAAAKAAKEAAKPPKKVAAPKVTTKTVVKVPAKAMKAVVVPVAAAAPVKAPAPVGVKPGPKKKAVVPEWTCPNDGNVYPWDYKTEKLLRNFENQVWAADADGGCGDWKGIYLPTEDRIDDSAADPYADDSDEEESVKEEMDTN